MAIAGSWRTGAVTPSEYVGATRWGTGINPIHAIRDSGSRETGIKENLLPLGSDSQGADIPEDILGPAQWGYSSEEAAAYPGEEYRYLVADHPNWGDGTVGRSDREGRRPYPRWGPHGARDHDFPLPAWPGGENLRAFSEGYETENAHIINAPTPGWRGGWKNKAHGKVEEAETSDPSQYEINTSMTQLHRSLDNNRATGRGTDDPRSPIATRLTGQKVKYYAKSSGMGGGPGTPDMGQQLQDLPYRPWFFRQGAMPPPPDTYYGTMTGFEPIERTLPVDAGEYVTQQEAPTADGSYGYTSEDFYG